jgi:hypothetical protein
MVKMMNMFRCLQFTTKDSFHYESVLKNLASVKEQGFVPVLLNVALAVLGLWFWYSLRVSSIVPPPVQVMFRAPSLSFSLAVAFIYLAFHTCKITMKVEF